MRKVSRRAPRRRPALIEQLERRALLSTIYSTLLDTSPGWTLDTGWQYGTPTGTGGDPTSGHTGTKVVGTVITSPGYYPDNVPSTYWAKTTAIDCSHYTGVTLDFWRWLGIEGNDRAYLQASNDGTSWTTIWANNSSTIIETAWSHQTYDISSVADYQSTVHLRWGLGPTNASIHCCGWNLDDVTVSGTQDTTPPTVSSINTVSATPTNATSVQFAVAFSENVTGVDVSDFALAATGTASGSIASVSGSGSGYTVTVNSVAGDGTLGLNLVDNDSIADLAGNKLGGTGTGNGNFTGQTYSLDHTAPLVSSINRVGSSRTNGSSVQYSVAFSESVTGVDASDFALATTGTVAGTIASVIGSGASYTVTVNSVSGDGTLGVNLVDNDSIADPAGNKLGGTGAGNGNFTGQTYSVDHTAPLVSSINRVGSSPTNASSVQFAVNFSEYVTGVDVSDFALAKVRTATGTIASVTGSRSAYVVTVNFVNGDGTLGLNLVDDDSIQDLAGNKLGGTGTGNGNYAGQTYGIDNTAPVVLSETPGDYGVSLTSSFSVDVTFSEPVTGLDATDLVLAGRAAAGAAVGTPANIGNNTWRFPISGATDGGMTLTLAPDADDITDTAGNNLATASWCNRVNITRKIAYISDDWNTYGDGWMMNADGSGKNDVIPGGGVKSVSFSHDGQEMVYAAGQGSIYIANADGTGAVLLKLGFGETGWPIYGSPVFSPDDSHIAYCRMYYGYPSSDIMIMNVDGSNETRLTCGTQPFYSPDGTEIVYSATQEVNNAIFSDIEAINVDGTGQRWLTNLPNTTLGGDQYPAFSPDGSKIVFTRDITGTAQIYLMNADGTGQTQLFNDGATDEFARFSPEGNKIVFDSNRDGHLCVYTANVDGSGQVRLTSTSVNSWFPSWGTDLLAPEVISISPLSPSPSSSSVVQFSVAFSEQVWGVSTADFALSTTGTAAGTVAAVSGTGAVYTITVRNISGDGTLGLNLVDDDGIEDQVGNRLGGYGVGNGNFTGDTCTLDHTAPVVSSINRVGSQSTNGSTVQYSVVFDESVTDVDTTDFAIVSTGTVAGTIASVSGSGTSYTVTVSSVTGEGTLGLNLVDDDSIMDLPGNKLGRLGIGNGNFTGQAYTIDHTAPTVVSINRLFANPTKQTELLFVVTFSEAVTGVDIGDFAMPYTGSTYGYDCGVTGSGTLYNVLAFVNGYGTLGLNLVDDDSIRDLAGNPLGGAGAGNGNLTGQVYSVDQYPPNVLSTAINAGAIQRSMVTQVQVVFGEAVNLATGAISIARRNGSAAPDVLITVTNDTGDQKTWNLTFSGTGTDGNSLPDGRYTLLVTGAKVTDLAGNVMTSNTRRDFFRLFGDYNGDRQVDRADLIAFRQALNVPANYVSCFDFDADGKIDLTDYARFRRGLLHRLI